MTTAESNQPSSASPKPKPKAGASLGWFKAEAFPEYLAITCLPSVQVALRQRLRLTYWLTGCRPLTDTDIAKECRAIALADLTDGERVQPVGQHHVDAVLTADCGFSLLCSPETGEIYGWEIPDLQEQHQQAAQNHSAAAQARSQQGRAAAAKRWAGSKATAGAADEQRGSEGQACADSPDF